MLFPTWGWVVGSLEVRQTNLPGNDGLKPHMSQQANNGPVPSTTGLWCGIKGFLPILYEETSLWEALSVVSQKWSFPTALNPQ